MSYPILFNPNERYNIPAIAGIAIVGKTRVGDTSENTAPFESQGFGTLTDTISCLVTEERNGPYELIMTYPITGVHFSELVQRALILARPNYTDDPQPFRIYKISKPLNGVCTVYAQHISYDLSGYEMPKGQTAANLTAAVSLLSGYSGLFNIKTTKTGAQPFSTDVPASVRSWLGGKEGSLLDLYGGEWHWDGYDCILMTERGSDRGVQIRYGKNLTSLQQEEECNNLYTAVRAYFTTSEGDVITGSLVRTGISLGSPRVLFLDGAGQFEGTPTQAQLTAYATEYIQKNNLTAPKINLTLDFVQMQSLAERVDLCDTVLIEFEDLGVSASAKCIKTVWDVLRERYTLTQFGDVRNTFAGTMATVVDETKVDIKETKSSLEKSIDRASALITGNAGGYVVLHDTDDDGKPDEILIMDTPNISTATKVWRWNQNGLGYSSTGYDGSYAVAMTADGQIVADFITTGTLSADRINGGMLHLGSADNADGLIEVYDSNGDLVAKIDKDGILANNGTFNGVVHATSGEFTGAIHATGGDFTGEINATSGTIDSIIATNLVVNSGKINVEAASSSENIIILTNGNYRSGFSSSGISCASPDGSLIAYTSIAGGQVRLYKFVGSTLNEIMLNIRTNETYARGTGISVTEGANIAEYDSDQIYLTNGTKSLTITAASNVAGLSYTVVSTF